MDKRFCRCCKEEKDITEFHKSNTRKDGFSPYCKKCKSEKAKKHREKFSEEIKLKKKEYAEKNKEKIKAKNKDKYIKNRDEYLLKAKEYRSKPEVKESMKEYKKKYKKNNHHIIRQYFKDRLKNDDEFRLSHYYRSRLNIELRNQKCSRKSSTTEIYGLTSKELYEYLLTLGYDKNIHHVDHIVPISLFNLKIKEHLLVSGYYLNLQPLLPEENMRKKNSLPDKWEEKIYQICEARNINPQPIINHIKETVKC